MNYCILISDKNKKRSRSNEPISIRYKLLSQESAGKYPGKCVMILVAEKAARILLFIHRVQYGI